jgi:hypothetical protein
LLNFSNSTTAGGRIEPAMPGIYFIKCASCPNSLTRDNGYKLWYNHFRCDVLYEEFATHLLAIAKAHSGQVIRTAA